MPKFTFNTRLAFFCRMIREDRGLTQEDFAEMAKVNVSTIKNV